MNSTIEYYNQHAQAFYDRTIHTDLASTYQNFLKYLPEKAHILDAGCGVGRDAKYFLKCGLDVTAFDGSIEMVALASQETGLCVKHHIFQEMNYDQAFDGVWAQASLLHIPYQETRQVYNLIHQALKPNGIFYGSYKYGQDFMPMPERNFWNMDEENIKPYMENIFDIIEIWTEPDTRSQVSPSQTGMWLNFIARKK